jgi:hypothetical protein
MNERFKVKSEQVFGMGSIQIVVDLETGVNYIVNVNMSGNSMTPLLDSKGKVVVDKKPKTK